MEQNMKHVLRSFNYFKPLAILGLLFFSSPGFGQSPTTYSVETDPATFAFNGYALHARVTPTGWDQWVVGVGIYSMDFPDLFIDMDAENKNMNWDVRLDRGLGLFAEHYFNSGNTGWYIGGQIALQRYKIKNSIISDGSSSYTNLLIMPAVGYRWFPMDNGIYIQPWMGVGYTSKISGSNRLSGMEYHISKIIPFATFHIGYRF